METYLKAEGIEQHYGDLLLFNNIELTVNEGDKIAFIAKNGTGKTTLLNILAGINGPDSGSIYFKNGLRIGYLEQEPKLDLTKNVIDVALERSGEISEVIKSYQLAIKEGDEHKIQLYSDKMDMLEAWNIEQKLSGILSVLKISDLTQPLKQLSGGQIKRVALASILVQEPDFYILDEPTNHLDIDMIEWLENYFATSKTTLLLVTHDRYFLDEVCNHIVELDNGTLANFKGNYSYYLEKKSEMQITSAKEHENLSKLYKKELEWARRMPKARGTKAKYRVDNVDNLKEQLKKPNQKGDIKLQSLEKRLGKKVLEIHSISKSYGDVNLIKDFSYVFAPGEKIGIIGANGCGKSTLLNIIVDDIKPDSGRLEWGETVKFGFYKQSGLSCDENKKVIEIAQDVAEVVQTSSGNITVSQFLNRFLFTPEMQHLKYGQLSGGEKKRLYLCTILMQSPNFLLLDEPTNDFDILTLSVLEEYLKQFKGCVLIVTHDRYFMNKLVDHTFVFEGRGIIKPLPGNFSEYKDYIAGKKLMEEKLHKEKTIVSNKPKVDNSQSKKTKLTYKEKLELEQLEVDIDALETKKSSLEEELSAQSLNHEELSEKTKELAQIMETINKKMERWVELSEYV